MKRFTCEESEKPIRCKLIASDLLKGNVWFWRYSVAIEMCSTFSFRFCITNDLLSFQSGLNLMCILRGVINFSRTYWTFSPQNKCWQTCSTVWTKKSTQIVHYDMKHVVLTVFGLWNYSPVKTMSLRKRKWNCKEIVCACACARVYLCYRKIFYTFWSMAFDQFQIL